MDNPENTDGSIKNGQSREYRRVNQKWTIQRIPTGQSKMNNPENTDGSIKNEQSGVTDNIGYTRRRKTKQKHNTKCVGHHYTQSNTNKKYAYYNDFNLTLYLLAQFMPS
jgi:hypothetical protein